MLLVLVKLEHVGQRRGVGVGVGGAQLKIKVMSHTLKHLNRGDDVWPCFCSTVFRASRGRAAESVYQ